MAFVGALGFALVVWAGMLWGSIKIVERNNPYNRFGTALIWSALNLAVSFVLREIALLGLALAIAYLVLIIRTLIRHYELGILKALAVIGLLIAAPYVLMPRLVEFVGADEVRALLVLYGLPLGILGVWGWARYKARHAVDTSRLPQARVVKAETRQDPAPPVRPSARAATAPAPGPDAPPPAPSGPAAVIKPVASVAPTVEAPASPTEGPRFLR